MTQYDRKPFFDAVRGPVFGGSLSKQQVDGLERLLTTWETFMEGSNEELAYNLATSNHETAGTMTPIMERGSKAYFDKYEPGTKLGKMLGNTVKGDGYLFRGAGDVQNTGRRNAVVSGKKCSEIMGFEVDFLKSPELRLDPTLSALCLFMGNREGWWTGKDLLDYIDGVDESDAEDLREYVNARRVVNGTDKAMKIAQTAILFEKALKAAKQ